MAQIEKFIMGNQRIKIDEICHGIGSSHGSVVTIDHDHLGMSN